MENENKNPYSVYILFDKLRRSQEEVAKLLNVIQENVKRADIQKVILWEELNKDPLQRCCPYSGEVIGMQKLLSPEVEIEHILPFN